MESVQKEIGSRLREARNAAGYDLAKGAERLGIAKSTLGAIETGSRPVRAGDLVAYAEAFGVAPAALIDPHEGIRVLASAWYRLDDAGRQALEQVAVTIAGRDPDLMRSLLNPR